jgi:hypothetical protein
MTSRCEAKKHSRGRLRVIASACASGNMLHDRKILAVAIELIERAADNNVAVKIRDAPANVLIPDP